LQYKTNIKIMFKFAKNPLFTLVFFVLLCATTACRQLAESLTKEVEIDLPLYPNSLVVESYLIPGQVYALLLSETISTETGLNLSFVNNAQVVIAHGTEIDTLKPLTLTINNQPLTAYFALKTVPADYVNVFRLEVKTKDGRTCSASTQILPPIALDSTVIQYNAAGDKASLLAGFRDNAATRDFYRYTVAEVIKGRDSIRTAQRRSDQALNGQSLFFSTAFRFEKKDTLKGRCCNAQRCCVLHKK
jgi:Domain of unknown function (DUF4249)